MSNNCAYLNKMTACSQRIRWQCMYFVCKTMFFHNNVGAISFVVHEKDRIAFNNAALTAS